MFKLKYNMGQFVNIKFLTFTFLTVTISFFGCNDDDVNPNYEAGSNEAINGWIYDQMEIYYYWENELPAKKTSDLNPEDYFGSLINSQDRFSWIQPNYQELLNSLQGVNKEAGYEYTLYQDASLPGSVFGQITYVKKNSPASGKDLKRGDLFREINGTSLNLDNYLQLIRSTNENHTLKLSRHNDSTEVFESIGTLDFNTIEFAENPNFLDTVYTINNKKIGYYIYNFFALGSNENDGAYEMEMNMVFQKFKQEGIQHLILDLRYNSGGAESATIDLASHIGSNITTEDIFVKRDFNNFLNDYYIKEFGESALVRKFEPKPDNIGGLLENQSVIILTSSRSASASELLINGLLPYMDVFLIGDKTVGKNVGSFSLYDEDDTRNNWGIQPIVTKSFNSLEQSDYGTGFIPNIELKDNILVKKELGDVNELLLARAIQELTGVVAKERQILRQQSAEEIYSSLETKRSFGIYTIELPTLN